MSVQGAGQSFRDQFSVPGMSQVLEKQFGLSLTLFQMLHWCSFCAFYFNITVRTSWVMTSKARDHMFPIMLLILLPRFVNSCDYFLHEKVYES